MPQPLPRYLRFEQKLADMAQLDRILGDVDLHPDGNGSRPRVSSADGHRDDRRRGLPMIGRGVSGAINHTDPLRTLIAKENKRRQS